MLTGAQLGRGWVMGGGGMEASPAHFENQIKCPDFG